MAGGGPGGALLYCTKEFLFQTKGTLFLLGLLNHGWRWPRWGSLILLKGVPFPIKGYSVSVGSSKSWLEVAQVGLSYTAQSLTNYVILWDF
jgi:hypothetical protein